MPSNAVIVRAPGKINVCLRVGCLQDDGYHEVATAYQAVSLCDTVRAWHADDYSVSFTGPIDSFDLVTDETNLAIRAARALAAHTGYTGGVRLEIEKHIPIAGGMGGGSADAAGALVACDALWKTGLSRDELHRIAATLGADVPFALHGGTAIGTGRGDQLSPALAQGQFHWVLALPDFELSTPEVYAELDAHRERNKDSLPVAPDVPTVDSPVLQALRSGDALALADALHNDLQPAALRLAPALADVLEMGERAGALASLVSGSGPTVAFLAADQTSAIGLQVALSAGQLTVVRVTGPVPGARVVAE